MSARKQAHDPLSCEDAIWQDVEFGAYVADLPLWRELAATAEGPVLELGAGSGRVALELAGDGADVVAVERDPAIAEELRRRAQAQALALTVLSADLTSLAAAELPPCLGAALAPLHVFQQLDPSARPGLLRTLADRLGRGCPLAVALVDESSLVVDGGLAPPPPDMRELEGWVFSSEPLWVQLGERALSARRLRERVAPSGEIERSVHDEVLHRLAPDALEEEAAAAGFAALERREVYSGPVEADSVVVIMEAR